MSIAALRGLAVLLLGVLPVAGCGRVTNPGSPVPSGTARSSAVPSPSSPASPTASVVPSVAPLTKDEAIAAARGYAGVSASAAVVSAEAGPFGQFDPNPNGKMSPPSADHWVWRIEFRDSGAMISGAIIDYVTGALVEVFRAIPN